MNLKGFERKLEMLLNYNAQPITPEVIRLEEEIKILLDSIQNELRPISARIHQELYPEDYDYV